MRPPSSPGPALPPQGDPFQGATPPPGAVLAAGALIVAALPLASYLETLNG